LASEVKGPHPPTTVVNQLEGAAVGVVGSSQIHARRDRE
jgi:hypothetical protein